MLNEDPNMRRLQSLPEDRVDTLQTKQSVIGGRTGLGIVRYGSWEMIIAKLIRILRVETQLNRMIQNGSHYAQRTNVHLLS